MQWNNKSGFAESKARLEKATSWKNNLLFQKLLGTIIKRNIIHTTRKVAYINFFTFAFFQDFFFGIADFVAYYGSKINFIAYITWIKFYHSLRKTIIQNVGISNLSASFLMFDAIFVQTYIVANGQSISVGILRILSLQSSYIRPIIIHHSLYVIHTIGSFFFEGQGVTFMRGKGEARHVLAQSTENPKRYMLFFDVIEGNGTDTLLVGENINPEMEIEYVLR